MSSEENSILICEYDQAWPDHFATLSTKVEEALREMVKRVEHVGSTAVPGLAAKPVIDLDVVTALRSDLPEIIHSLAEIGYVHEGDLGIPGREAFRCPPGEAQHHLYVLEEGTPELNRHLAFRDALRANADLRNAYATLKRTLALRHPKDRAAYTEGKSKFVAEALAPRSSWTTVKPDFPNGVVRRIRRDEGDLLRRVRLRALADSPRAFASTLAEEERLPDSRWQELASRGAQGQSACTLLAFLSEVCVGLVSAFRPTADSKTAELVSMWVAPEARGRGISESLVLTTLEWGRGCELSSIELWVTRGNDIAEHFYKKWGFTATSGYQALPYGSGIGVRMCRLLE